MLRRRTIAVLCAAALVAAAACDGSRPVPSPGEDVDAFLAAWVDLDAASMHSRLTESALEEWDASELEGFLFELVDAGELTSMEVQRAAPIKRSGPDEISDEEESPPATATAPIEITYSSAALDEDATVDAELELVYDAELDTWLVEWTPAIAFGGLEDAAGLLVTRDWGKRAPILDRDGDVLARGSGERRRYPHGSLAGATIGHLAPPVARRGSRRAEPESEQLVGASGLEAAFEKRLAGEPGTSLTIVDRAGKALETLGRRDPVPARPLRVTLDTDVQRAAASAFGGTPGGAVLLDPKTGDVLAAVSSSEIDPNSYVGVSGIEPFNRALSGLYPPGSSMKVVTAAAALEEKVVTAGTKLSGPKEYRGVRNFESGEFGTLDFATAVRYSVNTAFAQIAEDLGGELLTEYADAFGFNEQPALVTEAATSSFPEPADEGDLMWSSIGQAQVLASPLTMASAVATIANGGRRMEPRIAREQDPVADRVVSRKTATTLTRLLEGVVRGGTGTGAAISGVSVAGKTGTAEVDVNGERRNHAWFVAFAPADDPSVAVAVVAEYGGIGGQVAAPLARAILQATLPLLR